MDQISDSWEWIVRNCEMVNGYWIHDKTDDLKTSLSRLSPEKNQQHRSCGSDWGVGTHKIPCGKAH